MYPDIETESRPNRNLAVKTQVGSEFLLFLARGLQERAWEKAERPCHILFASCMCKRGDFLLPLALLTAFEAEFFTTS
jgi:hypothetical protein